MNEEGWKGKQLDDHEKRKTEAWKRAKKTQNKKNGKEEIIRKERINE
jgi:hypothetical protein